MDIVAVLAGLPAVLTALGEHLPGLLVAVAMLYVYLQREKAITAERTTWQKCETDRATEMSDLLTKVFAIADATNASLNSIAINLAAANRNSQVGAKIDELATQIKAQEVRKDGNAKSRSGQAGGKTG